MDATRARRTRDRARWTWYAGQRRRRFGRRMGFVDIRDEGLRLLAEGHSDRLNARGAGVWPPMGAVGVEPRIPRLQAWGVSTPEEAPSLGHSSGSSPRAWRSSDRVDTRPPAGPKCDLESPEPGRAPGGGGYDHPGADPRSRYRPIRSAHPGLDGPRVFQPVRLRPRPRVDQPGRRAAGSRARGRYPGPSLDRPGADDGPGSGRGGPGHPDRPLAGPWSAPDPRAAAARVARRLLPAGGRAAVPHHHGGPAGRDGWRTSGLA